MQAMYLSDLSFNKLTGYEFYPHWQWDQTQTVPPTDLKATVSDNAIVTLTWTPIAFTKGGGYYEISYAAAPDGPFPMHGQTADKAAGRYVVTGLALGRAYYFRVRTFTPAHETYSCVQQNDLWSDYSAVVSASTPPVRLWLPLVSHAAK